MILKYKGILFDDFTKNDDGSIWSQICQCCVDKFNKSVSNNDILSTELDDAGSGICGVQGCQNEANYYIDFLKDSFEEV